MKHLLLLILFSGSLDSFSQDEKAGIYLHEIGVECKCSQCTPSKPDTLRAICLITLGYRNLNVAHARMGFVVVQDGKRPVYLDCRKRMLKLPAVGWGYELVNPNNQK